MSDARWGDPREYDARDPGDEWPHVYDARDRDEHDPRDGLMRDLDLPRGDERELVVERDRVYELDGEDSRALAAVGAFRIVPEHDLDLPHDTLENLHDQRLVAIARRVGLRRGDSVNRGKLLMLPIVRRVSRLVRCTFSAATVGRCRSSRSGTRRHDGDGSPRRAHVTGPPTKCGSIGVERRRKEIEQQVATGVTRGQRDVRTPRSLRDILVEFVQYHHDVPCSNAHAPTGDQGHEVEADISLNF
jgi:hypothetical protein